MLNTKNQTCQTTHMLHAAGEYILADKSGDSWILQLTDPEHHLVCHAADKLNTSETNILALVMSHEGFDVLYDNWEVATTADNLPPASLSSSSRYRRHLPPYPFAAS
jgi:hypothetical protein